MADLDLHRLRILRELRERGTLAAVAEALSYSPSAISQQLAVLESEIGRAVIEKSGRRVRLTEAGELLAEHAARLLDAADAALADLDAHAAEVRGTVRAVGLQSAMRRLLIPALGVMADEHPHVRVELSEMELEEALPELRLGRVDLVLMDEYVGRPRPRPAGLDFDTILTEKVLLVLPASHPLAHSRRPVPLARLRDAVWTASDRPTGHTAMVIDTCRGLGGFEPDLRHLSSDAETQLELVRTGSAVALLPELTLPDDDDLLATRPVAEADLSRQLVAVTRTGPATGSQQALLDVVRRIAAES